MANPSPSLTALSDALEDLGPEIACVALANEERLREAARSLAWDGHGNYLLTLMDSFSHEYGWTVEGFARLTDYQILGFAHEILRRRKARRTNTETNMQPAEYVPPFPSSSDLQAASTWAKCGLAWASWLVDAAQRPAPRQPNAEQDHLIRQAIQALDAALSQPVSQEALWHLRRKPVRFAGMVGSSAHEIALAAAGKVRDAVYDALTITASKIDKKPLADYRGVPLVKESPSPIRPPGASPDPPISAHQVELWRPGSAAAVRKKLAGFAALNREEFCVRIDAENKAVRMAAEASWNNSNGATIPPEGIAVAGPRAVRGIATETVGHSQLRASQTKRERGERRRTMIAEQIEAGNNAPQALFDYIKQQDETLLFKNKKHRAKGGFISPKSMMRHFRRNGRPRTGDANRL